MINNQLSIKTPACISCDIGPKSGKIRYSLELVSLFDEISIEKINERKIQIIKTKGYKIPTNDSNLIYKASSELWQSKPNKSGAIIKIQKNIPPLSGLSSQAGNAAGVLIALNKLWGFGLSEKELVNLAKKVDTKIAEILRLLFNPKPEKNGKVILVLPKYIKIDSKWISGKIKLQDYASRKQKNPYEAVAYSHFPDLREITGILKKAGCERYGMSEKGPMLYGFYKKNINKQRIKKLLNKKSEFIWIK